MLSFICIKHVDKRERVYTNVCFTPLLDQTINSSLAYLFCHSINNSRCYKAVGNKNKSLSQLAITR